MVPEAAVTGARCLAVLRAPAVQGMAAGELAGQTAMPGSVVRGLGHQLVPGREIPGLMEPGVMS